MTHRSLSGNLLLFANGYKTKGPALLQIVEMDLVTGKDVWTYVGRSSRGPLTVPISVGCSAYHLATLSFARGYGGGFLKLRQTAGSSGNMCHLIRAGFPGAVARAIGYFGLCATPQTLHIFRGACGCDGRPRPPVISM